MRTQLAYALCLAVINDVIYVVIYRTSGIYTVVEEASIFLCHHHSTAHGEHWIVDAEANQHDSAKPQAVAVLQLYLVAISAATSVTLRYVCVQVSVRQTASENVNDAQSIQKLA